MNECVLIIGTERIGCSSTVLSADGRLEGEVRRRRRSVVAGPRGTDHPEHKAELIDFRWRRGKATISRVAFTFTKCHLSPEKTAYHLLHPCADIAALSAKELQAANMDALDVTRLKEGEMNLGVSGS